MRKPITILVITATMLMAACNINTEPQTEPVTETSAEVSVTSETTTEFSSHAKQDELIDLMRKFTNLKTVLINHGDAGVKEIFAKIIAKEINPKHVAILGPKHTMRVGAYGLLKSYPFNS